MTKITDKLFECSAASRGAKGSNKISCSWLNGIIKENNASSRKAKTRSGGHGVALYVVGHNKPIVIKSGWSGGVSTNFITHLQAARSGLVFCCCSWIADSPFFFENLFEIDGGERQAKNWNIITMLYSRWRSTFRAFYTTVFVFLYMMTKTVFMKTLFAGRVIIRFIIVSVHRNTTVVWVCIISALWACVFLYSLYILAELRRGFSDNRYLTDEWRTAYRSIIAAYRYFNEVSLKAA